MQGKAAPDNEAWRTGEPTPLPVPAWLAEVMHTGPDSGSQGGALALHLFLIRDTTIVSCPFSSLPCTLRVVPQDTVTLGGSWALGYLPAFWNHSVGDGQGFYKTSYIYCCCCSTFNLDSPPGMGVGVAPPQLILLVREDANPVTAVLALAPGSLGCHSSSFTV